MAHQMLRGAQAAISGGAVVRSMSAGFIGISAAGDAMQAANACRRRQGRQSVGEGRAQDEALPIHSQISSGDLAAAQPTTINNDQVVYNW